jgi:hypothetical protein
MNNWSDYEMYLKPVHLKGQSVTLTIIKATEEETHPQRGKTVKSPVLWFRELPFGLILSPTNRSTLIALYGDRVSDCIGKPIIVKAVNEKVAGRDKQPIRIQPTRPNAPKVEPTTGEIVDQSASDQVSTELPDKKTDAPSYCRLHLCDMTTNSVGVYTHAVGDGGLCNGTASLPDAPDRCALHVAKMAEQSGTGVLFHRLKDSDGKTVAYCDGAAVKPNGKH